MVRDESIFAVIVLVSISFGAAFQLGIPVPGQEFSESAKGHEIIDVPEPPSEALTNPQENRFRMWVEFYIHQVVNEYRERKGLSRLDFDANLREIARSHSQDMAKRGYYDHYEPDGDGPGNRYDEADYRCTRGAAENIDITYYDKTIRTNYADSVNYTDAQQVATGIVYEWMNSSGHRRNILNEDIDQEGIGIYYAGGVNNSVYATQNFC